MSAGETIQCNGLDDAFEYRDVLMREGYSVDLEHGPNGTILTIREVPEDE